MSWGTKKQLAIFLVLLVIFVTFAVIRINSYKELIGITQWLGLNSYPASVAIVQV